MLNSTEIAQLIQENNLIEQYIDLETQLTPNGFDLTVLGIWAFDTAGALDFSNKERKIPVGKEITPQKENPQDKFGWWLLPPGIYKIKTNETVNLPDNLIALAFSRTSLLRMGAFTQHGVWDAGFSGRGEFILSVGNPSGIRLKQNARVAQLIFVPINKTSQVYQGIYKGLK
ncbi:MAG: deoxyuridine 5'-triphosphate nucleotidohydrolase [Candidatus Omnitrophica bacterium]|nr:deoxyuridine 5'-triphosphate nucleotidohydrolase [Candidatus Omnitrophota bacterium]